ncbi:MAG: HAD family hydrolase [Candidatus Tectomicrobia bacterium]|nr:HAD family hydrolase [Candidatus Tectomicrobia bacterium]
MKQRRGFSVIQGILFDFFGTLVEYSASRVEQGYDTTHKLLLQHGIDITYAAFLDNWVAVSEALDQWSQYTGCEYSMEQVAVQFLHQVCPPPWPRPLPTQLWMSYVHEWGAAIRYIPGVPALLQDLSSRLRLGVVTNTHAAPLIHRHLRDSGIAPFVEVVVTSVEHERPKPHPSIFAAALDRLGCAAASTLFIGDSYEADYLGAKTAGMQVLLIDPFGSTPVPAHEAIGSVLDLKTRMAHTI